MEPKNHEIVNEAFQAPERVSFISAFPNYDSLCQNEKLNESASDNHESTKEAKLVGHAAESEIYEYERVCDICGVAGYRHLLASCSKCPDGAEHTYCMRVKLDALPGADWMCEECVLSEKQNRIALRVLRHRKSPNLEVKDLDAEKSRKSDTFSNGDTPVISSKMRKKHPPTNGVFRKSKSTNSGDSRMKFKALVEVCSRKQDLFEPPLSSFGKTKGVTSIEQKSTDLSDELGKVVNAERPKTLIEPFQKGENYSKRRLEFDLNHIADEKYACKKIKNVRTDDVKCSNGVSSETLSPPPVSSLTCPSQLQKDIGERYCKSRWEIDLNCSPPHEEDSPKKMIASDTSIISADLGSTGGSTLLKLPQCPSYSNDTLESRVVNAECPMPIHGEVLRSKLWSNIENNDEDVDGPAALLSLSLALSSYSRQEQAMELEPKTKLLLPEWRKYIVR